MKRITGINIGIKKRTRPKKGKITKIIGIDVGGSHISAELFVNYKLAEHKSVLLGKIKTKKQFFDKLFTLIDSMFDKNVKKIGMGFPAPVVNGRVFEVANIPSLNNTNLQTEIRKRYNVRCRVDNDVNCFLISEQKFGAAAGKDDVVAITLGTGIGCAMMIDGKLHTGHTGGAGEISRVPVTQGGELEDYTGSRFLEKHYKKTPKELADMARKGSKRAKKIWEKYGKNVGVALAFVVDTLDPQVVVIGGNVAKALPYFRRHALEEMKKHCFKYTAKNVRIKRAKYDNSNIVGAALL